MKKITMMTVVFGVMVGAGCVGMYRDQYGRVLPRHPAWTLKSGAGDPHGLLQYDVVYVHKPEDKYFPGYCVMRFWPSGHFMTKFVDNLNLEEIDSFVNAQVGYYQARSSEDIRIEVYAPINFGQYYRVKCQLDVNGDVLEISYGPTWTWWHRKYPQPRRFVALQVGKLSRQPDW